MVDPGGAALVPNLQLRALTTLPTSLSCSQAVRSDGPGLWASLCPQLLAGAAAQGGGHAELACLVLNTLAEDVTVYNDDLDGGHMRALLSGLTSTLTDTLPFLYSVLQVNVPIATDAAAAAATPAAAIVRSTSVDVTHAALAAAASHAEWAPLAALARSGVLAAACALLTVPPFRLAAVAVLRAAVGRRITDVEDDKPVCHDAMDACAAAMANAAAAVVSSVPGESSRSKEAAQRHASGDDEDVLEFGARLTDAMQTHAVMHLPRSPSDRARLLAGLLALTRHPSLRVCAPAWVAWLALLRQAGAPASGAMGAPQASQPPPASTSAAPPPGGTSALAAGSSDGGGTAAKTALDMPDGLVPALADATGDRLCAGGGLAGGCDTVQPSAAASWEEEFDSPEEMRDMWLQVRSHAMNVARMCCALAPAHVLALAQQRLHAAAVVASSPTGDAGVASPGAASGPLEGAVAFLEAAVSGASDAALAPTGAGAGAAHACLATLLAIPPGRAPGVVLQLARGLEACGRIAASRPEAATAVLAALFAWLERLPGGGSATAQQQQQPDSAIVAAVPRGSRDSATVARQRVCTAVLGVAATAGGALRPHLARLADTLGTLQLRGTERGTLAEALLTVAQAPPSGSSDGPSGPDVLGWLLAPVAARWEASPPPPAALQPQQLADAQGPHWPLFDDLQLLERCLRRLLLSAAACAADGASRQSMLRALTAHATWALPVVLSVCRQLHSLWTPAGREAMHAAGLASALDMSAEEVALYSGARDGPSGAAAGATGGSPSKAPLLPPLSSAANATGVDPDMVRAYLRGIRDACYGLIALALPGLPASGPPGAPGALPPCDLYAAAGVPDAVGAALMADLDAMEIRHVRQLTKSVIQPLLCRTPQAYRPHWFACILPRLLPHMRDRLTAQWAQHRPPAPPTSSAADTTTAEVVHDRVLRDATRAHTAFLAALVNGLEPSGSTPQWAELPDDVAGLSAACATAAASLTWPDGESACKGAAVCRALVAASADGLCTALPASSPAWGQLLSATLQGFMLPSNGPYAVELLNLVRDLLVRLSAAAAAATAPATALGQTSAQAVVRLAPALRAVLAQLPSVGDAGADALEADLQRMRSDRDQRSSLKTFLLQAAGGSLPALAVAEGSSRSPASAVTVTRMGAPAERRARGGHKGDGFGAAGGSIGLAALGDT